MKPQIRQRRLRCVVILSALYASGRRDKSDHVIRSSFRDGVPRRLMEECFIHLSLLLGFPAMLDGLERLAKVVPETRRRRRRSMERNGYRILQKVYGLQTSKLLNNLRALHPELPGWIRHKVYGAVFTRAGMNFRERELCNVVVLSFQGLQPQLISHVRGVLKSGLSSQDLMTHLRLAARVAGRKAIANESIIRTVVSQKKNS